MSKFRKSIGSGCVCLALVLSAALHAADHDRTIGVMFVVHGGDDVGTRHIQYLVAAFESRPAEVAFVEACLLQGGPGRSVKDDDPTGQRV